MDPNLRELYQEVIIDHGRHPRNFRLLEGSSRCQKGYNPLCGDHLEICLHLAQADSGPEVIDDIAFQGEGCAISVASASLMTECLKGKTPAQARALFERFHRLLTEPEAADLSALGKLRVLAGVREFPIRIKCATLAWHALKAALEQPGTATDASTGHWVSTE